MIKEPALTVVPELAPDEFFTIPLLSMVIALVTVKPVVDVLPTGKRRVIVLGAVGVMRKDKILTAVAPVGKLTVKLPDPEPCRLSITTSLVVVGVPPVQFPLVAHRPSKARPVQ